ncbi:hypothetical protein ABZ951_26295 [Streptomyces sp. NPDC046215]|uniref:hypothetical protein n=1 Tax=Streptomyces TaxID=1883 RepID=UPI0033D317C2
MRNLVAVAAAVEGCESVYHCAARISTTARGHRDIHAVNVLGTRNVPLDAARRHGVRRAAGDRFVQRHGLGPGTGRHRARPALPLRGPHPVHPQQGAGEHECCRAAAQGLDVVVAVSMAIIGPHDYVPSRMGRVLLDFARGRLFTCCLPTWVPTHVPCRSCGWCRVDPSPCCSETRMVP